MHPLHAAQAVVASLHDLQPTEYPAEEHLRAVHDAVSALRSWALSQQSSHVVSVSLRRRASHEDRALPLRLRIRLPETSTSDGPECSADTKERDTCYASQSAPPEPVVHAADAKCKSQKTLQKTLLGVPLCEQRPRKRRRTPSRRVREAAASDPSALTSSQPVEKQRSSGSGVDIAINSRHSDVSTEPPEGWPRLSQLHCKPSGEDDDNSNAGDVGSWFGPGEDDEQSASKVSQEPGRRRKGKVTSCRKPDSHEIESLNSRRRMDITTPRHDAAMTPVSARVGRRGRKRLNRRGTNEDPSKSGSVRLGDPISSPHPTTSFLLEVKQPPKRSRSPALDHTNTPQEQPYRSRARRQESSTINSTVNPPIPNTVNNKDGPPPSANCHLSNKSNIGQRKTKRPAQVQVPVGERRREHSSCHELKKPESPTSSSVGKTLAKNDVDRDSQRLGRPEEGGSKVIPRSDQPPEIHSDAGEPSEEAPDRYVTCKDTRAAETVEETPRPDESVMLPDSVFGETIEETPRSGMRSSGTFRKPDESGDSIQETPGSGGSAVPYETLEETDEVVQSSPLDDRLQDSSSQARLAETLNVSGRTSSRQEIPSAEAQLDKKTPARSVEPSKHIHVTKVRDTFGAASWRKTLMEGKTSRQSLAAVLDRTMTVEKPHARQHPAPPRISPISLEGEPDAQVVTDGKPLVAPSALNMRTHQECRAGMKVSAVAEDSGTTTAGPVVVCVATFSDSKVSELADEIVMRLGGEIVSDFRGRKPQCLVAPVNEETGHVSCRKMVIHSALASGVPIVGIEWLVQSFQAGFWLETRPFESKERSPGGLFDGVIATFEEAFFRKSAKKQMSDYREDVHHLIASAGGVIVDTLRLKEAIQQKVFTLHLHVVYDFGKTGVGDSRVSDEEMQALHAAQEKIPTQVVNMGWLSECLFSGQCPPRDPSEKSRSTTSPSTQTDSLKKS